MAARSFGAELADAIRKRRNALRLTQEEVAQRASLLGLDGFTRSVIAAIEGKRRALSFPEVVLMSACLETSLAELLPSDMPIALSKTVVLDAEEILSGLVGKLPLAEATELPMRELDKIASERRVRVGATYASLRSGRLLPPIGEAEIKAGRKLGVPSASIADVAQDLWGRTLTEERDALVAELVRDDTRPERIQALRGHATRKLVLGIQQRLAEDRAVRRRKQR